METQHAGIMCLVVSMAERALEEGDKRHDEDEFGKGEEEVDAHELEDVWGKVFRSFNATAGEG